VEDFEHIAREAAPEVSRVRCIAASDAAQAGLIRVLIVPAVTSQHGRLRFEQLRPADETLSAVRDHLDERRVLGSRVLVEPAAYRGLTVVARLRARVRVDTERLEQEALEALYRHFHPTEGGPDGIGWPFGRPVQAGEVYSVLQRLRGTEFVEDVRLFAADPETGTRGKATDRLEVEANALVFSYEHQVMVQRAS